MTPLSPRASGLAFGAIAGALFGWHAVALIGFAVVLDAIERTPPMTEHPDARGTVVVGRWDR